MALNELDNKWILSAIVFPQGTAEDGVEYSFDLEVTDDGTIVWITPLIDDTSVTFHVGASRGTLWIQPSIEGMWTGSRAILGKGTFFTSAHKKKWPAIGIATYLLTQLPDGNGLPSPGARKHFRDYLRTQSVWDVGNDRMIVEVVPTGYLR